MACSLPLSIRKTTYYSWDKLNIFYVLRTLFQWFLFKDLPFAKLTICFIWILNSAYCWKIYHAASKQRNSCWNQRRWCRKNDLVCLILSTCSNATEQLNNIKVQHRVLCNLVSCLRLLLNNAQDVALTEHQNQ